MSDTPPDFKPWINEEHGPVPRWRCPECRTVQLQEWMDCDEETGEAWCWSCLEPFSASKWEAV